MTGAGFFERLAARTGATGSFLCVGLDPHPGRHDVRSLAAFLGEVVEATAPFAACFKPNLAFYEAYGLAGLRALERVLARVPADVPVIGDAKRGDIGSTAEAYARAAFEVWGFDAVTVSPYLGFDGVRPFLEYPERGVYVLCRTSAAGAEDLQLQRLADGRRLFERVAELAAGWGPNVGLVVGATAPEEELRAVRRAAPVTPVLVPGIGAQGGELGPVVRSLGAQPGRLVVNVSRAILYAAAEGEDPVAAAAAAAERYRRVIAEAVESGS